MVESVIVLVLFAIVAYMVFTRDQKSKPDEDELRFIRSREMEVEEEGRRSLVIDLFEKYIISVFNEKRVFKKSEFLERLKQDWPALSEEVYTTYSNLKRAHLIEQIKGWESDNVISGSNPDLLEIIYSRALKLVEDSMKTNGFERKRERKKDRCIEYNRVEEVSGAFIREEYCVTGGYKLPTSLSKQYWIVSDDYYLYYTKSERGKVIGQSIQLLVRNVDCKEETNPLQEPPSPREGLASLM